MPMVGSNFVDQLVRVVSSDDGVADVLSLAVATEHVNRHGVDTEQAVEIEPVAAATAGATSRAGVL